MAGNVFSLGVRTFYFAMYVMDLKPFVYVIFRGNTESMPLTNSKINHYIYPLSRLLAKTIKNQQNDTCQCVKIECGILCFNYESVYMEISITDDTRLSLQAGITCDKGKVVDLILCCQIYIDVTCVFMWYTAHLRIMLGFSGVRYVLALTKCCRFG